MKQLELTLTESQAKIVLEALLKRESDMSELCRTSDDEDLVADTGNDLIELRLLLKPLRERALATFGPNVLNFSRDEL
jgi:transcription initiation factor IIE alpha subunit